MNTSAIFRATLLAATMASFGCSDQGQPMVILQNQVPGDGCVVSGTVQQQFLARGTIDVSSPLGYVFTPVIRSLAQAPVAGENGTNIVFIQGVEVLLSSDGVDRVLEGAGFFEGFSVRASATLQPGGTTSLAVTIVPAELLQALPTVSPGEPIEIVASVKVFGELDGNDVESPFFDYPITVCNGCLIENVGECTALDSSFVAEVGSACNPLQDGVLECCTSSTGEQVCPATAEIVAAQ